MALAVISIMAEPYFCVMYAAQRHFGFLAMPHAPSVLKDELASLHFWADAFRAYTRIHGDPRMAALANRFASARVEAATVGLRFSSRSMASDVDAKSWGARLLRRAGLADPARQAA